MYELKLARPRLYRVKRGQTSREIYDAFCCPVPEDAEEGDIILLPQGRYVQYRAGVGESYASIAAKFGMAEEELKELNGGRAVYPTCRVLVPEAEGH